MKYEKSCGAIIVNERQEVLLLKHKAGHWAFPKGHVENNETEEETALREIKEETNLDVEIDNDFRECVKYSPAIGIEKEVVYFRGYNTKGTIKPQMEEVTEIKWYNIEEAIEIVTYENDRELLRKIEKYIKKGLN